MKTTIAATLAFAALARPAIAADAVAIAPLSPEARTAMTGKSWRQGCPISLDDLAVVKVIFIGFDGADHSGTIVVHKQLAPEVADIFNELRAAKFPISTVAPWEEYGPRVYAEQNVTTGFYCETAQDNPGEWSSHAYGYSIDLNPLLNPFHNPKAGWWPPSAGNNVTRDDAPGKVSPTSPAFTIFAEHGWAWGDLRSATRIICTSSRSPTVATTAILTAPTLRPALSTGQRSRASSAPDHIVRKQSRSASITVIPSGKPENLNFCSPSGAREADPY